MRPAGPPFIGGSGKGCGGCGGKGRGGFEEEDRSRDWYCPKCRERNFVKRAACFKCGTLKPKEGDLSAPPRPTAPANGTTLNGMVKSYNRKGFGFLMCLGTDYGQDIYYTRENLSPKLQTRDIPGQHVTFEIHRFPDGKLTALNIRPLGEDKDEGMSKSVGKGKTAGKDDEDRSRDWVCAHCNERNFVKRFECFKCKKPRASGFTDAPAEAAAPPPKPPARTLSPHAGSRAVREMLAGGRKRSPASRSRGSRGRRRERSKDNKRRRSRSRSSRSASSGSSRQRGRRRKEDKKRKRDKSRKRSSSSSSASSESSDCKMEQPSAASAGASAAQTPRPPQSGGSGDPEVDAAKAEALDELLKLRSVEPKEARMTEWRALLRKWHPDKNPDRVEVATAVFQFLQRGKAILDDVK